MGRIQRMDNARYHVIMIAAGCSKRLKGLTRNVPKSLLKIGGKRIIDYHLDSLDDQGFSYVTFVVGYLKQYFMKTIGNRYKELQIDYVVSEDYEATDHGWSLFLSYEKWKAEKRPVVLVHPDIVCHPRLLDLVSKDKHANVVAIDNRYDVKRGNEVVVTGKDGIMTGFKWGIPMNQENAVGELIGVNKWSAEFMEEYYSFMQEYFAKNGRSQKYEPVFAEFLRRTTIKMHYLNSGGLGWININYPEDYEKAKKEVHKFNPQ